MSIALKRAYDPPSRADGKRILVDRLWPRGVTKDAAAIYLWLKEVAPSNELRKWYHARPSMWLAFREKYLGELRQPHANAAFEQLQELASSSRKLTLVYSSRNEQHNNAVVLKELLDGTKKPPHKVRREPAAEVKKRAEARG